MALKFVDDRWTLGEYVAFRNLGPRGGKKTNTYHVLTKIDNQLLGIIGWYSSWYKYTFKPTRGTIYEEHCLRDIAEFCETETQKYKAAARRQHDLIIPEI